MARRERCEGGCDPKVAPVVIHDSEGIPLCIGCWNGMLADGFKEREDRLKKKIRRLEAALQRCVKARRVPGSREPRNARP